ncbi:MAG TPA: hypothetical protein VLM91_21415 [Candidatus Methylomirabilis sp.]|nr:hypothetical protein [Candidatus Methylomirabilis sp.]
MNDIRIRRSPVFEPTRTSWRRWLQATTLGAWTRHRIQCLQQAGTVFLTFLLVSSGAALAWGVFTEQILIPLPSTPTAVAAEPMAEAGGLWLRVKFAAWDRPHVYAQSKNPILTNERSARRLEVRMSVQNPTDRPQAVSPHEFQVRARSGAVWPAVSVLPVTMVRPKQAVTSILAFNVPAQAAGLQLVWTKAGHEVRIPLADAASSRGRDGSY